jgi:hypothetical protein
VLAFTGIKRCQRCVEGGAVDDLERRQTSGAEPAVGATLTDAESAIISI